LENSLKHKKFLIVNKYLPHFLALFYAIYTLLGCFGIDAIPISYFVHVSIFPGLYMYNTSVIFRFCYVHRLPIYYIGINELITAVDYYLNIPISDLTLLAVHSLIIASLIFGYSYYYVKHKIK